MHLYFEIAILLVSIYFYIHVLYVRVTDILLYLLEILLMTKLRIRKPSPKWLILFFKIFFGVNDFFLKSLSLILLRILQFV